MKIKIQIKSVSEKVLFELEKENNTIKETLEQAVKENANLEYANLEYANLECANLYNANLYNANLNNANLEYANLNNANLYNANLYSANLYNANLRGANLKCATINNAKNKETAFLPIFCKWSYGIKVDLIVIGCKQKTIEEWDIWFNSNEEYSTSRGTDEFKQIEAIYNSLKYYYLTLNK